VNRKKGLSSASKKKRYSRDKLRLQWFVLSAFSSRSCGEDNDGSELLSSDSCIVVAANINRGAWVLERAHGGHQERDEVATPERGRVSPPGLAANVNNTDEARVAIKQTQSAVNIL